MSRNSRVLLTLIVFALSIVLIGYTQSSAQVAEPAEIAQAQPPEAEIAEIDDEAEEEDNEEDEGEWQEELEMALMETEIRSRRLEMSLRIAEIAENPTASAAFAISHVLEFFEEEEEALEFFQNTLQQAKDPAIQRMLRIKLAELYAEADEPEKAHAQLKALIIGK